MKTDPKTFLDSCMYYEFVNPVNYSCRFYTNNITILPESVHDTCLKYMEILDAIELGNRDELDSDDKELYDQIILLNDFY